MTTNIETLAKFSDKQLKEELKRRKQPKAPKMLSKPDWESVFDYIQACVNAAVRGFATDNQYDLKYVFDLALTAVYGPGICSWYQDHRVDTVD